MGWGGGGGRVGGGELEDKETKYWIEVAEQTICVFKDEKIKSKLWFQFDRGADAHEILDWIDASKQHWVTVRICQNRNILEEKYPTLFEASNTWPLKFFIHISLPRRKNRAARDVLAAVCWKKVQIPLRVKNRAPYKTISAWVVDIKEMGIPCDSEPLHWRLLTTRPVRTKANALEVIKGYKIRWRIEDFHRCYKTVCRIEDSLLESFEALKRWAVIQASVAVRIERLKHLARTQTVILSKEELSVPEMQAILSLHKAQEGQTRKKRKTERKTINTLTISQAVLMLAELGGYTGATTSGGPPGSVVIGRGLEAIAPVVQIINLGIFKLSDPFD